MKTNAQKFDWATQFSSTHDDQVYSICTDANGNVYTTGSYFTLQDFDSGPGTFTLTTFGYEDIFITKHDSDGNFVWAKHVGGSGHDIGKCIKVDAFGNIYVSGIHHGGDFDPGPSSYGLVPSNFGGDATFILKLDINGNFVWAHTFTSFYAVTVSSLTLGNYGEVYITGFFTGTVDFDPDTPVYNLSSLTTSNSNAYILKLDNSGNFIWAKKFGENKNTLGKSIKIANNNDVFVIGDFLGTVDFDPNVGIVNLTSHNSLNPDCFILKLDSAGNLKWVKQIGATSATSGGVYGYSLNYSQTENLYISGSFSDAATDFDPGNSIVNLQSIGIFILKLDTSGKFKWVKGIIGGFNPNRVSLSESCLDNYENIYTTGGFENNIDFNPGFGTNSLSSLYGKDGFILKLDSAGNFNWVNQICSSIGNSLPREGTSICTGPNNKVLSAGYFVYQTDFNSSPAPQDTLYMTSGNFFGTYYKDSYIYCAKQDNCSGFTLLVNSSTNVSCNSQGVANATAINGTFPLSYSWNTVPPTPSNTAVFNGSGIYSLTVIDSNLCSRSTSLLVNAPTTNAGFDLDANIVASSFRPGFTADVWIDAYNGGCIPKNGQLKVILSNFFNYNNANIPPDFISGDTLIWNFSSLIFDSAHIVSHIIGTVDVSAQIGNSVCFKTIITPFFGDSNASNNYKTYCYPIINGYDPNIKSVYPAGECADNFVLKNQKLTYSVKFQNTGNSNAININVLDSLDSDFDLNTLKVIASSHPLITEVLPGNVLKFKFNNIMLPDSAANEELSHGYLIYEITPFANLSENTEVKNRANIYFDFNPPINTNQVKNKLISVIPDCNLTVTIEENQKKTAYIYPNPTNDYLIIENVSTSSIIKIYDMIGKLIVKQKSNSSKCIIDTSNLQDGIFLVDITEGNESTKTKIIVRR